MAKEHIMTNQVSSRDPHRRERVGLLGSEMSYVDVGHGDPIVFLHGNPTSSYLWRNIIPWVNDKGRCLAPDLMGMGHSAPPADGGYRFFDHVRHLDAWFDAMKLDGDITLVLHDWGSALGFHYALRHPDRIRAIAYMEAIVKPLRWSDYPNGRDDIFRALRSPQGEQMVLQDNFFVEAILPNSVIRELTDVEMSAYRAPYPTPESRLPTLTWPRELPIDGEPKDVADAVRDYSSWLATSPIPKLFIAAEPGALLTGPAREFCRTWTNQRETTVPGRHFLQEDSPAEIGQALRKFIGELDDTTDHER